MKLYPEDKSKRNKDAFKTEDVGMRPILHHRIGATNEKYNSDALGVTIVCISDTHGHHRDLQMPPGGADILIHAGDYTNYGSRDHAVDFNKWLGELGDQYSHKIVVHGNHECNSSWKSQARSLLSNATLLVHEQIEIQLEPKMNHGEHATRNGSPPVEKPEQKPSHCSETDQKSSSRTLKIFGTAFSWPVEEATGNPTLHSIDDSVDILISHGPAKGYLDVRGLGCPALLSTVQRTMPRVVVSGHIHGGRGVQDVCMRKNGGILNLFSIKSNENDDHDDMVTFVNAANAGNHRQIRNQPIILYL